PTITPTQIIVPDISNTGGGGHITFVANQALLDPNPPFPFNFFPIRAIDDNESGDGLIDGNRSTFVYQQTAGAIQILNYSTKDLVVNNIDVLNHSTTTNSVDINVKADSIPFDAFAFNVVYSFAPSLVDIENRSTTGSPNIILGGLINNPI